jgi:hypothetical protein
MVDYPVDAIGFVYIIYNLVDGRKYIGKKLLKFRKTKVVKGKKKRSLVESDWKYYWGSNDELKSDVEKMGEDKFKREIIHFAKTKGTLSYLELREQMDNRVLEKPDLFYNRWIMARIATSHVKL